MANYFIPHFPYQQQLYSLMRFCNEEEQGKIACHHLKDPAIIL